MAASLRTALASALGALACVASLGCGHPASEAECEEILGRLVELELAAQHVTDPAEIARRRDATLGEGDAGIANLRSGCVGKRITDRAIACVRAAKSAEEITEVCLR
jgi:hypothetical protein